MHSPLDRDTCNSVTDDARAYFDRECCILQEWEQAIRPQCDILSQLIGLNNAKNNDKLLVSDNEFFDNAQRLTPRCSALAVQEEFIPQLFLEYKHKRPVSFRGRQLEEQG